MQSNKFKVLLGLLVVAISRTALSAEQPWPVEFPNKLLNKAPVSFPLKNNSQSNDLPGEFIHFVSYLKTQCREKFQINYNDQNSGKFLDYTVAKTLNKKATLTEACLFPFLVSELDGAGTKLRQKSKLTNQTGLDLTTSLASASFDFDLQDLSEAPHVLTRYFVALRLLKQTMPNVVAETSKWPKQDLTFNAGSVRQFGPWLTELSSYGSLAKYYKDLDCIEADRNCKLVKGQLLRLLQKTAVLILNSEQIKKLIAPTAFVGFVAQVPEINSLKILEPVIEATLNTQSSDLFQNSTPQTLLDAMDILQASTYDEDFAVIDTRNDILNQAIKSATQRVTSCSLFEYYFSPCDLTNKNRTSVLALKFSFAAIYQNQAAITDKDYFRKFISIKKLYDTLTTINTYSLGICEHCLAELSLWESNANDQILKETRIIYKNVEMLLTKGLEK